MLLPPLRRLLETQALRFFECFIRAPSVPAEFDNRNENVVGEFHPSGAVAIFVGKEPAVHQFIENGFRNARFRERIIERTTVAMAAGCEELLLHKASYADRKIFERARVEIFQDFFLLDVEK